MFTGFSVTFQYMYSMCNDQDNWKIYHFKYLSFISIRSFKIS
jgi:hypothetical protein